MAQGLGVPESELGKLDAVMDKLKDGQFTADEVQFVSTFLGQLPYDKSFPGKFDNFFFHPHLDLK